MAARLRRARPRRHPHGRHVRHDQRVALVQPRASRRSSSFSGWRCSTSCRIDFSRFSSRIRFNEESRGTVFLAFGMGAVAALLAGACVAPVVDPGRRVRQRPVRAGTIGRARAARSCSASAWRCRGRSPAPGSRRCRSRAPGWSASSRRWACSSSATAVYYGYRRLRHPLRADGSIPRDVQSQRRGTTQGRLARVAGRRPAGGRTRQHARARRLLGDAGARTAW